jgi:hypothetical protein
MKNYQICICLMVAMAGVVTPLSTGKCTEQERDTILVDGKKSLLLECPLLNYWTTEKPRPEFDSIRSSNWKGFTVNWELVDEKLWVIGFEAKQRGKMLDPISVFGKPLPIHASWVNGPIYVVDDLGGNNLDGFASKNWRRMFLIDGVVRKRTGEKSLIRCNSGIVGLTLKSANGEIIIDRIQENSPAAQSALRVGMSVAGMIDVDGETIMFDGFTLEKARQCIRGLIDDRMTLLTKTNEDDSSIVTVLERVEFIRTKDRSSK